MSHRFEVHSHTMYSNLRLLDCINKPKLLICDEPTGNLDPDTSMEIMKVLDEINAMGTTIIMATHDRDIVDRMKKRVILLDRGRLAKDIEKGSYCNERF